MPVLGVNNSYTMKDRIRKVMESQHMTQQEFADFIHLSPASLSSIFTGRTRPTVATVEAIKKSLPNVSTDWLLFGTGDMFINESNGVAAVSGSGDSDLASGVKGKSDEGNHASVVPERAYANTPQMGLFDTPSSIQSGPNVSMDNRLTVQGQNHERLVKNIDIPQRTITEIRIFYSDQTWETFVPKK